MKMTMITLNYTTWLKQKVGHATEEVSLPDSVTTINHLFDFLENKSSGHKEALRHREVIYVDINGHIVDHDYIINGAKEVSFFSPIVGG